MSETACQNCGLRIVPLPGDVWMHDDRRRPGSPRGWSCDPRDPASGGATWTSEPETAEEQDA